MKMINSSHFLKHEACPKCTEQGKDNAKNNLAIYSDGHNYCFACGYKYFDSINRIKNNDLNSIVSKQETITNIKLPEDILIDYPQDAIKWISIYDLTVSNLHTYNVLWSDAHKQLIFPVFNETGCIFYSSRNFSNAGSKWINRGKSSTFLHCLNGSSKQCIIVEDIVSAIKLHLAGYSSIPLFGTAFLNRLDKFIGLDMKYFLWLDPDKIKESIFFCRVAVSHSLDIKPIVSRFDPKEHSFEFIKGVLNV